MYLLPPLSRMLRFCSGWTIAIFCLTSFSTFIRSAKKSIVEHVIVVTFAFAVVDAATGCVARDKSGGSRG